MMKYVRLQFSFWPHVIVMVVRNHSGNMENLSLHALWITHSNAKGHPIAKIITDVKLSYCMY